MRSATAGDRTEATPSRFGVAAVNLMAEHPVLTVFAVCCFVRAAVAVGLDVFVQQSLILDDAGYTELASEAASGERGTWDPTRETQYWRNSAFLVPLTVLYALVGPVPLAGQWLVGLAGASVAALTTLLGLELVERRWAVVAGLMVGLLPSQIFFSSLTLKDAFVWCCVAGIGLAVAAAGRSKGWRTVGTYLFAAALALLLTRLRAHTSILAAWVIAASAAVWSGPGRLPRLIAALLVMVGVPWVGGLGPAGTDFVRGLDSVSGYREAQASGNTAIIPPTTTVPPQATGSGDSATATEGGRLDQISRPPPDGVDQLSWYGGGAEDRGGSSLSHLPRGLVVMLLEPHPLRSAHNTQLLLAKLEMAIWYPMLLLGLLGIAAALNSQAIRVLAFPVLFGGASVLVAALAEGNFGTAFRHRGEIVWVVALLAALGLREVGLRLNDRSLPPGVACQVEPALRVAVDDEAVSASVEIKVSSG